MRTRAKIKPGALLKAWLLLHAQSFVYSLGQYYRNLLSSILTTAVIGISLALPAGFYLLLENAQQVTDGWGGSVQITAFLKTDIDDAVAKDCACNSNHALSKAPGLFLALVLIGHYFIF